MSRSLLDILAASKEDEPASDSLIAVLGGKSMVGSTATDDQFKLPDLVLSEAKEQTLLQQEQVVEAPAKTSEQTPEVFSYPFQ